MKMTKAQMTAQIYALKKANELMIDGWGTFTNEAGFLFCDSEVAKELADSIYVSPFSAPINGQIKPLLMNLYIQMNNSMIETLEYRIKKYEEKQ